tara:strand:+ start:150 stop:563 length:414 start_codon:yes stop_codon:yes gene_type:complete
MDELKNALENQTNVSIIELTTKKIEKYKDSILSELCLSKKKFLDIKKKLKKYRYCTDLKDIHYGYYIRYIPLKDPEKIHLTNGGVICDIKILNNEIHILCKNNIGGLFQIKFDENIIFQKITPQEKVILNVLDYLDK